MATLRATRPHSSGSDFDSWSSDMGTLMAVWEPHNNPL